MMLVFFYDAENGKNVTGNLIFGSVKFAGTHKKKNPTQRQGFF